MENQYCYQDKMEKQKKNNFKYIWRALEKTLEKFTKIYRII